MGDPGAPEAACSAAAAGEPGTGAIEAPGAVMVAGITSCWDSATAGAGAKFSGGPIGKISFN